MASAFQMLLSCFFNLKDIFFHFNHVPAAVYAADLKIILILTTIYTALVAQFRQIGVQEAEGDEDSKRTFRINSEWTNHSISGGVSDKVLWNCRDDSRTDTYYKTIYLGLILIYLTAVLIYCLVRIILTFIIVHVSRNLTITREWSSKLENTTIERKVKYLDYLANGLKYLAYSRKQLEEKLSNAENNERPSPETFANELKMLRENIKSESWKFLNFNARRPYNWSTIFFVFPMVVNLISFCILTLTLTSYDIHPLGCLSHINVSYCPINKSVTLTVSENVIRYQQASVIIIVILTGFLGFFNLNKFYSTICRYKYYKRFVKIIQCFQSFKW